MENEKLTRWFLEIAKVTDSVEQAEGEYKKANPECEDYNNPFCQDDILDGIKKLREKLIDLVIGNTKKTHCPNLELDTKQTKEKLENINSWSGKKGKFLFDAQIIEDFIKSEYLPNADEQTIKQLLEQTKTLLPHISKKDGYWGTANEPGDIQQGNKLRLRAWVQNSYSPDRLNLYDRGAQGLLALDKLIQIVLEGIKPQEARTGIIGELLSRHENTAGDFFRLHKLNNGGAMVKIRAFKNNNFDIEFETEEKAFQLAELLIRSGENARN